MVLDLPAEALGAPLGFKAAGAGDNVAALPSQVVTPRGVALRPLSPATVTVRAAAGDRLVTWQRRSRAGFPWSDGTDAPIAEDSERYHLIVRSGTAILREVEVTVPAWTYSASDYAVDAATGVPLTVEVAQISATVGSGLPTIAALT